MSAPVLPFTVHKGGKRAHPSKSQPTEVVQKLTQLIQLDPMAASMIETMIDEFLTSYPFRAKG